MFRLLTVAFASAIVFGIAPAKADSPDEFLVAAALERDRLDPARVSAVAALGTREAAEALVEAYDLLGSVYLRREVVYALQRFDGNSESEGLALQKIADVATGAEEPELHNAAVDALGRSSSLGKQFLRRIVDSSAGASVRVRALENHIRLRTDDDIEWYEELFEESGGKATSRERTRSREGVPIQHSLMGLRELALGVIAPGMKRAALADLARQKRAGLEYPPLDGIRRLALIELDRRGDRRLAKLASSILKDGREAPANRILAARILHKREGAKAAKQLVDIGTRNPDQTSAELRDALADIVAEIVQENEDLQTSNSVAKQALKGSVVERLFALRALREGVPGKYANAIQRSALTWLSDEDVSVRVAAARWLAEQGVSEAVPKLRALVDSFDPAVAASALTALGTLRRGESAWTGELLAFAGSDRVDLRNLALRQLHVAQDERWHGLARKALNHPHWSTRLVALELLCHVPDSALVGALVERLPQESGRVLFEFYDALWRLTGMSFQSPRAWSAWWRDNADGFAPIRPEELAEKVTEAERRRLMMSSSAPTYFGVRVRSNRAAFIVDVSGSMKLALRADSVGEPGRTRFDAMQDSLSACIGQLDAASQFNVIAFSGVVDSWLDSGITPATAASKTSAQEYVQALRPGGGTNIYDSLELAFSEPEIDTIFLLSDGHPSQGSILDQHLIRTRVQLWNEGRGLAIHSIAIGEDLPLLRWLAEDSGGDFTLIQ